MKRASITVLFLSLVFLSFILSEVVSSKICGYFSGLCISTKDDCIDIGPCSPTLLDHVFLSLFYFGPFVLFGIAGFIFGGKPRSAISWFFVPASLICTHVAIIALIITTSRYYM